MIGDRGWLEDLGFAYQQHLADSARFDREPQPFERWAVTRTWPKFVRLARLCAVIPEYDLSQWETKNPVPGANGTGYSATVLARRLIDGLVLTRAAMTHVYRCSHSAHAAVKAYLDDGKVCPGEERALAKGKRLVYDWLRKAAETEEVLSQRI